MATLLLLITCATPASSLTLGSFTFDDNQFGDSLIESDGGAWRAAWWLNLVRSNPGNPGALTGASFDTGIANLGGPSIPTYTIGYNSPIVNRAGIADLGIVSARFSTHDSFSLAVSVDGSVFSSPIIFDPASAITTGEDRTYWCCPGIFGSVQTTGTLFVTPVDLSLFGLADGATIQSIQITGSPDADLIRVAGLISVPEPSSLFLLSNGLLAMQLRGRARRRKSRRIAT